MSERLSDYELEKYASGEWTYGNRGDTLVNDMATELLTLRADVDRSVSELREAGYDGTLSEMVRQACELREKQNKLVEAMKHAGDGGE